MTQEHPITLPPELVEQWCHKWTDAQGEFGTYLATLAARWGADQELEACCQEVQDWYGNGSRLHTARRPKPLSLNEVALQMLSTIERDAHYLPEITDTIRRALEQLDD